MNDRFKFRFYAVNYKTYVDATIGSFIGSDMIPIWKNGNFLTMEKTTDVIPEQCTGLKDKNGNLIYENDLIKCPSGIYRIAVDDFGLWTAIYNNNPFEDVAEWGDVVKEYAFNQNNVEIEVLGNIHENVDLIEEKQDD